MSTTQLRNEIKQKLWLAENGPELFGLRCKQEKEWASAENKELNCDADVCCIVVNNTKHPAIVGYEINAEVNVSLKTIGGDFTAANLGTSPAAQIFQKHILLSAEEKELMKNCDEQVKAIKHDIIKHDTIKCDTVKYERWQQLPLKGKREKEQIKTLYMNLWLRLINSPERVDDLYRFINERTSPLKLRGTELIKTVPYTILPEEKIVKKIEARSGSLQVGDFALRFKSAGGLIMSSWKINLERFYKKKVIA